MNRSFSKIRHIEKSNILLEQRFNPRVPEDGIKGRRLTAVSRNGVARDLSEIGKVFN
jgi:hypothetical protein